MKKLVTVMWSTTMEVDLPEDATVDTFDTINSPFAEMAYTIKSNGYEQISAQDAEITDVQNIDPTDEFGGYDSEEAMNKGIEAFIAHRKASGQWNKPKE